MVRMQTSHRLGTADLASATVSAKVEVMANWGASFWGFKEGATASIRAGHIHDLRRDQSCNQHRRYATIQTGFGDRSGDYLWNRDCCNVLRRAVLQRVEECGIPTSWH